MSATKINTYAGSFGCPRRFYYQYIAKIPGKPSLYFPLGNIPHKTLELFFKLKTYESQKDYSDLRHAILNLHEKTWNERLEELNGFNLGPGELEEYYQESREMIINWLHSFLKEKPRDLSPATERTVFVHDLKLMCKYDRRTMGEHPNAPHIIDYKTGKSNKLWNDTKLQLIIQWICHHEITGDTEHKVGAHFLRFPDDPDLWIPTEDEIDRALKTIEHVRGKTRTTDINDYLCTCGGRCKEDFIFGNGTRHNPET